MLFIDLQGCGTRVEPLTALATFLGAPGVLRVPESQPEREALYHSRLAKRRPMLVVLDNASSSEQVRPRLQADDSVTMLANLLQATDPADTRITDAPQTAHEIAELSTRKLLTGLRRAHMIESGELPGCGSASTTCCGCTRQSTATPKRKRCARPRSSA